MKIQFVNQAAEPIAVMQVKYYVTARWLERATIILIMCGEIDSTNTQKPVRKMVIDLIRNMLNGDGPNRLDFYPDEFKEEYTEEDYCRKEAEARLICQQYFPEFYK